jgi:ABC-type transport system involved in multi-copper enzyme maturation permease subunit
MHAEATVREPFPGLARNRARAPPGTLTNFNKYKERFMTTTALTSSRQQTRAIRRPHPLLSVVVWELRRFRASRLFWIQALCFFVLVLFMIWATQSPGHFSGGSPNGFTFDVSVAGTSIWGLLLSLQAGLLLLPGLLLPFVNADGVTRDLQRRTHELLMTTALPTRAYVWGRYLMGLLVSLGLALLTLAAILGMYLLLHLTVTMDPLPQTGAVLLLWLGMVVPATVLVSSVSFALGTLFPRLSTLIKVGILLAWFIGVVIIPSGLVGDTTNPSAWYSAWDPTSATTVGGLLVPYRPDFTNQLPTATSAAQVQHILLTVENTLPDIGAWFAPHLIEAGLSLLLVLVAALTFQRFRHALS